MEEPAVLKKRMVRASERFHRRMAGDKRLDRVEECLLEIELLLQDLHESLAGKVKPVGRGKRAA